MFISLGTKITLVGELGGGSRAGLEELDDITCVYKRRKLTWKVDEYNFIQSKNLGQIHPKVTKLVSEKKNYIYKPIYI